MVRFLMSFGKLNALSKIAITSTSRSVAVSTKLMYSRAGWSLLGSRNQPANNNRSAKMKKTIRTRRRNDSKIASLAMAAMRRQVVFGKSLVMAVAMDLATA
jgi:hypothetical protein